MAGVTGTGISSPSAQLLNTLDSISQKFILPEISDQIFIPSPAFWKFTKDGKHFYGGELVYPLATAEDLNGGAYYGDQLLNTAVVDNIQPANQLWRFYYQSCAIPLTDLTLNAGPTGIINLAKAKWQIATASILMKLSRALWGTAPQNTTLDIDNIPNWAYSTTNTIAGINRSSAGNAFWQPAANFPVANAGVLAPDDVEGAYQSVTYGYDEPDLMLLSLAMYRSFKKGYYSQIRYNQPDQDTEAVQFGFRYHLKFDNLVIFQDRFLNAYGNVGFMINTKYMFPVFHPADYFNADPFIKPSNQRVVVAQLTLAWNLACIAPRMQCALTNF